jgi:hypothetical protein
MTDKLCVVLLCNKEYYNNFRYTCNQLITTGCYKGDITLVIGDDLYYDEEQIVLNDYFIKNNNINVKYFPDYNFSDDFLQKQKELQRDGYWFDKRFQYHKFNLFDTYFKKWDYIFYVDCNIKFFSDITPILNEKEKNIIFANRDGIDKETAGWCIAETPNEGLKIGDQFVKTTPIYDVLKSNYNMRLPYFQTTVMLYDTNIIAEETKNDLYNLLFQYPICVTNDQPIVALYFTQIKPCWKQLRRKNEDTYFYDYVRCVDDKYIMLKSTDNRYLSIGYV